MKEYSLKTKSINGVLRYYLQVKEEGRRPRNLKKMYNNLGRAALDLECKNASQDHQVLHNLAKRNFEQRLATLNRKADALINDDGEPEPYVTNSSDDDGEPEPYVTNFSDDGEP